MGTEKVNCTEKVYRTIVLNLFCSVWEELGLCRRKAVTQSSGSCCCWIPGGWDQQFENQWTTELSGLPLSIPDYVTISKKSTVLFLRQYHNRPYEEHLPYEEQTRRKKFMFHHGIKYEPSCSEHTGESFCRCCGSLSYHLPKSVTVKSGLDVLFRLTSCPSFKT